VVLLNEVNATSMANIPICTIRITAHTNIPNLKLATILKIDIRVLSLLRASNVASYFAISAFAFACKSSNSNRTDLKAFKATGTGAKA